MGMKDQFQEKSEQLRERAQERMGQGGQGHPERQGRPEREGRPGGQERQRPGGSPQERGRREMDEMAQEDRDRIDSDYDV